MIRNNPKELSYYYHGYDIIHWLNSEPAEEDISENERQKKFQKFEVIKRKLDYLCPDNWDIKNFHHFQFFTNDRKQWFSGNIDLVVRYHYELEDGSGVREVYRTLAGSATFCIEDYAPNTHFGATCKSLCIANAAMLLGPQFSWALNPDEEVEDLFSGPIPKQKIAPKEISIHNGKQRAKPIPPPDMRIKYATAVEKNDQDAIKVFEAIYNFQTPS